MELILKKKQKTKKNKNCLRGEMLRLELTLPTQENPRGSAYHFAQD